MHDTISLICGNWGNTNLKAFGINAKGVRVTEVRTGPGVLKASTRQQRRNWFDLTEDWTSSAPRVRHLLSGAVGSNVGWLQTGYVRCPMDLEQIGAQIKWQIIEGVDVGIVPGLAATTPMGEPDRLRGEETELLGWRSQATEDNAIVCMPGTHCKWVQMSGSEAQTFMTGFVGELFSLLETGSILINQAEQKPDRQAFEAGMSLGQAAEADLIHQLFSVRGRQLAGQLAPESAAGFLSGMMIGADVSGALRAYGERKGSVTIIASSELADAYTAALQLNSVVPNVLDSLEASVLGFSALQAQGI